MGGVFLVSRCAGFPKAGGYQSREDSTIILKHVLPSPLLRISPRPPNKQQIGTDDDE